MKNFENEIKKIEDKCVKKYVEINQSILMDNL